MCKPLPITGQDSAGVFHHSPSFSFSQTTDWFTWVPVLIVLVHRPLSRALAAGCTLSGIFLLIASTSWGQSFEPQTTFPVGNFPLSMAARDLNADGKADLVTASYTDNTVSVQLGTGTGTFGAATFFPVGTQPSSLTLVDVNADGKPDIITSNIVSNNVSVLLGTGTGNFGAATSFTTGGGPRSVAVADVNGDGKPDLLTANLTGSVSVLLGTGGGSFGAATNIAMANVPVTLTVADISGDGQPDIITADANSNTVSVLVGTGTGSFGAATSRAVGTYPIALAVGDVNRDGKPDLITANANSNDVSVLLGTGGGSFGTATAYGVGLTPYGVALGDVNSDGKPDLITANIVSNTVSVLLGTGGGSFGPQTTFAVGNGPSSVVVKDVNGDGKLDIIATNQNSNTVSVLLNMAVGGTGQGNFTPPPTNPNPAVGNFPRSVAVGDVDGDGDLDLITANGSSANVSVRLNDGAGNFTPHPINPNPAVGTNPISVALGDVDGDGDLDFITANYDGASVSVRLNDGAGNFTPPATNPNPAVGTNPRSVVLGDVDGDGDLDFIAANNGSANVSVRLNDGAGHFTPPATNPNPAVGSTPASVALGDVDGDGDLDVLAVSQGSNTVSVRLNDGAGHFTPPAINPNPAVGTRPFSVALGDVDGDGDLDLIAANITSGNVSVRLNDGLGNFTPSPTNPNPAVGSTPVSVALGDVDGDSDLDLLTANYSDNTVSVRLNDGAGNFTPPAINPNPAVGGGPYSVALGDVDGDGDLDFIAANQNSNNVSVRLNQPLPPTITGFAVNVNTFCVGSPLTFTATVGNVTGAYNFTLTNGTPTGTTVGTATGSGFSQGLTAGGNGPQSFTLTVGETGSQATATTSVTVNAFTATASASSGTALVGSVLSLTANGGSAYLWSAPSGASLSSPATSSAVSATLTNPGLQTFTVVVSQGSCSQTLTVGFNAILPPDLTPLLYARPTLLYGSGPFSVVVDVVETNGVGTTGLITLRITKDTRTILMLDNSQTSVGERSVNNSSWSMTMDANHYILTSSEPIVGGGKLSVGLSGPFSAGSTTGVLTCSATVLYGSESNAGNNSDADKIEYFQQ